jgi:hypothetical protein
MIYAPGIILTSLTGAGLVLRQKRKTAYYEGKNAGLLMGSAFLKCTAL